MPRPAAAAQPQLKMKIALLLLFFFFLSSTSSQQQQQQDDLEPDVHQLPIINLRDFLGGNATVESRKRVAEEWDRSLSTFGFAAIVGHGVPSTSFRTLFDEAKGFFTLPLAEKMQSCPGSGYGSAGGFTPGGIESVSRTVSVTDGGDGGDNHHDDDDHDHDHDDHDTIDHDDGAAAPPDLVESLVFLRDWSNSSGSQQQVLPPQPPGLVPAAADYQRRMAALVGSLHQLSSVALGLSEASSAADDFLEQYYFPNPSFALRLAYYPPLEPSPPPPPLVQQMTQPPSRRSLLAVLGQGLRRRLALLRWRVSGAAAQCKRHLLHLVGLRRQRSGGDGGSGHEESGGREGRESQGGSQELDRGESGGAVRYGAHTDYQGFTILRQDPRRPGLEILFPDGQWRPVHDVRKTQKQTTTKEKEVGGDDDGEEEEVLLVNVGDLLQQWTNDRWRSTMHRVRNPPRGSDAARSDRLSLVFFTGPRDDALIEVLPCCVDGPGQGYAPVLAGDHLMAKLSKSNV